LKRVRKYFIIASALTALLASLALPVWLLGTTSGARCLLDAVSRHTDIKISAGKIEGKVAGALHLENTDIQWPQGKISIQSVELSTQPFDLLTGELGIHHLSLSNLSITDNTPDKPPELIWPKASGVITFLRGRIKRLAINNLTYRHLDKQPLQFQTIVASANFRNSHLAISNLHLVSDQGVVDGNMLAGFNRPLLEMVVTATPPTPLAGMDLFRFAGKFGPGKKSGELTGRFHLSVHRNKQSIWEISTNAGMTTGGFPLKHIRMHQPGRPGLITADGNLTVSGPDPLLTLTAKAADMDLTREFKIPVNLSGSLTFAGNHKQYKGHITVAARKEKEREFIRLAGDYAGNAEIATLNAIQGTALDGTLTGRLNIAWQNDLALNGALNGRNLNPARIDPNWTGVINFDLAGGISIPHQKAVSGEVICTLRQSRLHGQQLTGDLRATFGDDDIRIQQLILQGKGFQLTAAGALRNKLDFTARISDLALLVPETAGKITADGWVRWWSGRPSGVISAEAGSLNAGGLEIASATLNAVIEDKDRSPLSMDARLSGVRYPPWKADTVILQARGTAQEHTLAAALRSGRYESHLALSGSYHQGRWRGKVNGLNGTDSVGPWKMVQPAALSITANSLSLAPLKITGRDAESVNLSGNLASETLNSSFAFQWNALNLARANAWMDSDVITGSSSGNILLKLLPQKRLTLTGKLSGNGTLLSEEQTLSIRQSELSLNANEKGTRAALDIDLTQGGKLQGTFTSSAPARLKLPDEGLFNLQWQGLNLSLLSVWLADHAKMEGQMAGEIRGKLLPNGRFDLTGQAKLAPSKIHWQGEQGDVSVNLHDASLTWAWRQERLSGDLTVTMADAGKLQSRFSLPVAARLPIAMNNRESLQATLAGQVREKGALGVLFPGLVQESRGELDLDLKISGTWDNPLIEGNAHLSKAGAYLPTAGISVKDAEIAARLTRNTIHIDSFRAVSGPGYIDGSALIRLKGWQVEGFEGQLNGDRFQMIYFPELQVQSSPRLTFTGTAEKMSVRGEVHLPEIQIIDSQSQGPVQSSPDVIREGKTKPAAKKSPVHLDVQVKLVLGDRVHFKGSGIDAQLGGHLDLQFQQIDKIVGQGEIRVVKGRFRTYGVNLEIVRGRLFYEHNLINQPTLDILAMRKVGDIRAGVAVSGTLQTPLVKLYSEPFMQDTDILAYIVLGHSLGSDSKQANLLALAAGALLTSQQAEDLQKQLKGRLGILAFDISTDVVEKNGRMGYKRINVVPAGAGINSAGSVPESMLVVGKYLTPKLYISYGRSLFSGGNLFFLRYDLSKHWQIETQTGQESGIDVYYKLEFN